MNQRDMRPPFAALGGTIPPELEKLPTPCYLLDEDALTRNAEILGQATQNRDLSAGKEYRFVGYLYDGKRICHDLVFLSVRRMAQR